MTLGKSTNRVAHAKSGIPKNAQKFGKRLLDGGYVRLIRGQKQKVNIRIRKKLTPAISAHCRHRIRRAEFRLKVLDSRASNNRVSGFSSRQQRLTGIVLRRDKRNCLCQAYNAASPVSSLRIRTASRTS